MAAKQKKASKKRRKQQNRSKALREDGRSPVTVDGGELGYLEIVYDDISMARATRNSEDIDSAALKEPAKDLLTRRLSGSRFTKNGNVLVILDRQWLEREMRSQGYLAPRDHYDSGVNYLKRLVKIADLWAGAHLPRLVASGRHMTESNQLDTEVAQRNPAVGAPGGAHTPGGPAAGVSSQEDNADTQPMLNGSHSLSPLHKALNDAETCRREFVKMAQEAADEWDKNPTKERFEATSIGRNFIKKQTQLRQLEAQAARLSQEDATTLRREAIATAGSAAAARAERKAKRELLVLPEVPAPLANALKKHTEAIAAREVVIAECGALLPPDAHGKTLKQIAAHNKAITEARAAADKKVDELASGLKVLREKHEREDLRLFFGKELQVSLEVIREGLYVALDKLEPLEPLAKRLQHSPYFHELLAKLRDVVEVLERRR